MAGKNDGAAIIIKRPRKKGHEAHHGGAWKVAYADFVTAMMAFFLLLWLLNATTEVQKQGISDYFSPSTVSTSTGGAGGMLGGRAVSSPGAMTSRTAQPSVSLSLEPTTGATEGKAEEEGGASDKAASADPVKSKVDQNAVERQKQQREQEDTRFDEAEHTLRQAIKEAPDLRGLENHLLIDRTDEGLRIQIIDQEGQPMFPSASARMFERTRKLLEHIAKTIQKLPNKVRITGHTDNVPYRSSTGRNYGNWELSSDRAQVSRRVLIGAGLDPNRISSVAGRADREPLLPDDPASPRNRRISILLLREPTDAARAAAAARSKPPPGAIPPKELKRDWSGPRVR